MQFPDSFFEDEVRDGFYVPALMKRAWAAQLEVLADIAGVCEKHHIRWFAYWGTLLGAVRHGGFVPWDDDLDICMLRDDYIRFNKIAEKELPKGYYIPRGKEDGCRLHTTVWNREGISLEPEHLEKYHGFPFASGLDIFVLDYIAPDPEDEEIRRLLSAIIYHAAVTVDENNPDSEETKKLLAEVEDLLHITLDRSRSLKDQLFPLVNDLFGMYTAAEDTSKVVYMPRWMAGEPIIPHSLEYFTNPVMLPFETMKVPAPSQYDEVLKVLFGNYREFFRGGDSHVYPYYRPQEKLLTDAIGADKLPFKYHFSREDLKKNRDSERTKPGKLTEGFIQMTGRIHEEIFMAIKKQAPDNAKKLLELCQDNAIRLGNILERTNEKKLAAVGFLEEYCERIWNIYEALNESSLLNAEEIYKYLSELLIQIDYSVKNDIKVRKEVVFLPFKASLWDSLEPFWQKADKNPDCDAYVIPIPYYYRNLDGSFREMQYEGTQFPDYIPIIDYNSYDFKNRQPDIIFIHNPYDECNLTTSVHPYFYSKNLKQYTDELIYVPYFTLDESEPEDYKAKENMEYYIAMPGVVHSDKVIVQSEQIRLAYIEFLAGFAGEDTKSIWEKKITAIPFDNA